MPSIRKTFQQLSADGRMGKKDVEQLLKGAISNGVSKTEAADLRKVREQHEDKFTGAGLKAMDRFLQKMGRSWSSTKQVHLPYFDESQLRALMNEQVYGGGAGRTGGSESGRRTGGGEFGRSTGGSESSSTSSYRPTHRTGGSESSYRPTRSSGGEYGGGRSWGGGGRSWGGGE